MVWPYCWRQVCIGDQAKSNQRVNAWLEGFVVWYLDVKRSTEVPWCLKRSGNDDIYHVWRWSFPHYQLRILWPRSVGILLFSDRRVFMPCDGLQRAIIKTDITQICWLHSILQTNSRYNIQWWSIRLSLYQGQMCSQHHKLYCRVRCQRSRKRILWKLHLPFGLLSVGRKRRISATRFTWFEGSNQG